MTISSFCHEQLQQRGPLPLDVLARLAVDAGVTRSRTPESAVRSAVGHHAAELPDGRWASPTRLLEGRWLTTRRLCSDYIRYDEESVRTHHDLAPLRFAVRGAPIPLATGGVLKRTTSYGRDWRTPDGWSRLECGPDQLFGLQLREGVLHVEVVDFTPGLRGRGPALALALGRLDEKPRGYWSSGVARVEGNLLRRLWQLTAAGTDLLSEPAPPLSECVPSLAAALRAEADAFHEQERHWRPQLDLPAELQQVAIDGARRDDVLLHEWLNAFVTRALRAEGGDRCEDRVRLLRRLE